MNYKNKLVILGLFLFIVLSVSSVSAEDNLTDINTNDINEDIIYGNDILEDNSNDYLDSDELLSTDMNDEDKIEKTSSISTTITVNPVTINEGSGFSFTAKVKASNNMAVPGQVEFRCGNNFTKDLDSTGSAKISLTGKMSPKVYTWTAVYLGGTTTSGSNTYKFLTSTTTIKLTVIGNAVVTADNFNSFYQSGEKYQIKVINSYNNDPISNKKIKVLFYTATNKYTTSYYYTNNNGIYEGTIDNLPGNYKIVASLDDSYYNSNQASFNVSIGKKPVKLVSNQISNTHPYATLKVQLMDTLGNKVNNGLVVFSINGKTYSTNVKNGIATTNIKLSTGTYDCVASFSEDNSYSNNTKFKVVVSKAGVKLKTYKLISTTKLYFNLKALVKDTSGNKIKEGVIKFTINGKTYTANVKNGIATKKIKLKKAKSYKYKATFSSKNYQTKTSSSKVIVKKAKKYYTFKYGKLKGKLSYKQYLKLLKAYNDGKYKEISVKTGKYNTYKVPKYTYKKVTSKKWKKISVLDSEFYYYPGGSDYEDYQTMSKYTKKGWTWCGSSYKDIDYGDGYSATKYYYKFKKKVKVTEKKKVKNGYKKVKYKIEMVVSSTEDYNGFSIEFYDNYEGYLGGRLKNII